MAHEKGRCWVFKHIRFQIGLYSVGFLAGLAALIVFSFVLVTPAAAVWGGISMLYSGFLVIDLLRAHNIKDRAWVLPLVEAKWKFLLKMIFAVVGFSLSGTFCIYYIIMWYVFFLGQDYVI